MMMMMMMQDDNDNDAKDQLHILSWPLGQISQKALMWSSEHFETFQKIDFRSIMMSSKNKSKPLAISTQAGFNP